MELVVADIGGTHARFAIAVIEGGAVVRLSEPTVLRAADYASLQTAWQAFAAGRILPRAAALAVACPVDGKVLKLTNNPWVIHPHLIPDELGVNKSAFYNDFTAVAHAVAHAGPDHLRHLCGPDLPLPDTGAITIVGPGTGLGVGLLVRQPGSYQVVPTEGGHSDFAPVDSIEDAILARLRPRFRRVSVERVVSGPGLVDIHEALAALEGRATLPSDDKSLWTAALAGEDSLAGAALDRFCLSLGSVTGDIALTQGAGGVVIAGGLGLRLAGHLPRSGFGLRFVAKGRFEAKMAALPVKLLTLPQPGLYGAAAAFAQEHGE